MSKQLELSEKWEYREELPLGDDEEWEAEEEVS